MVPRSRGHCIVGKAPLYHLIFSYILYLHCLSAASICLSAANGMHYRTDKVHFGCNKVVK